MEGAGEREVRERAKVEGGKPLGSSLPVYTVLMICHSVERGWVDRQQFIHSTAGLVADLGNDGEKAKMWS